MSGLPDEAVEAMAQDFERWFTDYPATHRLAGQSVEVMPVSAAALPAGVYYSDGRNVKAVDQATRLEGQFRSVVAFLDSHGVYFRDRGGDAIYAAGHSMRAFATAYAVAMSATDTEGTE